MFGVKVRAAACAVAIAVFGGVGMIASPATAAPGKCHTFSTDLKQQRVKPNTKCKDVNLVEVRAKRVRSTVYWGQYKVGNSWRNADARLELRNGKVGTKILISNVRPGTIYQVRANNGAIVKVLH
ncbi:hypothetical protein [Brevibacterium otitidis]|uniref:Uncharacterized protein n=1 Tax=Brevibacterium otitidis TaxID=53364 RepID=A0ABV5X0B9_9MICO|nr:hypothetical protein GCM10023233_07180 [Brevibacterium otitidis]